MKLFGVLVLIFIGFGLAAFFIGSSAFDEIFGEEYERFRKIQRGMTDEEVIAVLGEPFKIYYRATAPSDYYVEGYSYRRRDINHKLFIYLGSEPIAYIYFNKDNKVEDTFVGGS